MAISRLFDYVYYQFDNYPQEHAFGRREGDGWLFYSTADLIEKSRKLASGLVSLGLKKGDKVSMIAYKNRPEWVVVDLATLHLGITNVPLYPTISPAEYEYILNEAEVKLCFVGGGDLYEKVAKAKQNVPTLGDIYTFDKMEGKLFWEDLFNEDHLEEVEEISKTIKSNDLATIIYTSGTTGNPKGVMLTHNNIISVVSDTVGALPITNGIKALSFLPFCHVFERAVIYAYTWKGVQAYCVGTDNLGGEDGDLRAVKPAFFTTVPRLLEKVYEKIYNKGLELTGLKKKLFFWALSLTDDHELFEKPGGLKGLKMKIADKLIFSKWREALGGNLQGIVTGAAPCPAKIAKVFSAAGIPIMEGYGLTETSPTISINLYTGEAKIGTVGPVIPSVDVLIDQSEGDYREGEGEILAKGPNIMQGYYKKPEVTASVFKEIDGERWFRTGDIGKLVDGPQNRKYLKITDRKKELLKTSGGKYVAPAPIESKFKEDFLIEQIMVVGDKQKFVSALIVPADEALMAFCEDECLDVKSIEEAIEHPKVIARFQQCCDELNPNFSHIEQIKKFKLLNTTWDASKEDGSEAELTPTMKLKRRVIREKFKKEIEDIYS